MKEFGKKILKYLIVGIILYIGSLILVSFLTYHALDRRVLSSATPYFFLIIGLGLVLVFDLMRLVDGKGKNKSKKAVDKVKDTRGKDTEQFFNRDFVTEELKKNKAFNYNTLTSIRSSKKDGILVRAEEKNIGMDINFVEPIHTLCVGTTSSGKTSRFVVPSLQLMSMTASKPSFVITDPKGELYDKCAHKFESEGYDVKVLNLREPFASVQWNPLLYPFDMYTRSFNLDKEVKVHPAGDNPRQYNLILQRQFDYTNTTWFEFDGNAYADKQSLESDMQVTSKELYDKSFNALNDICTTLAPIEDAKQPSWEKTAQKLIQAVMLAMLEDSRVPELDMTRDKYNLYNVQKICNMTDSGRDTYATLKKYLFDYRDKFSKVAELATTALQNADTTTKNYMGFVSSKTSMFSDMGISYLTANTEIDFVNMDEKPTAIFCIIPDEIRTRYPLAILFVTQLYKRLVDKAQKIGGRLKRNVYFMLDEFGNMPAFPEFGSIMTVGRSRGIYFELCVQSYSQLYQIYGQDVGKIIKDNCPIQVYIATEDMTTNKEFSELLGKKTIVEDSENKSVGADGKETKSYSQQTKTRPLVYPEELMTFRDQKKIIIKTFTPNACLKTSITSIYEAKKCYDLTQIRGTYVQKHLFDENAIYYDIKRRNQIVANQGDDDFDDDDDDLF